jgi:membrane protein implicated in regulation of membrane protease activity
MDFLDLGNPWLWITIAIVFLIFEFAFAGTFYFLMIAAGTLVGALVSVFTDNPYIIVPAFAVVTVLLTIVARPLLSRAFHIHKEVRPSGVDALIGSTGVVEKAVSKNQKGEVKVSGEIWSALHDEEGELAYGEEVIVKRVDGITLVVERKGV